MEPDPRLVAALLPAVRIMRHAVRRIAADFAARPANTASLAEIDADMCGALLDVHAFPDCPLPHAVADMPRSAAAAADVVGAEFARAAERLMALQPCDCAERALAAPAGQMCRACMAAAAAPIPMHWRRYCEAWIEQLPLYSLGADTKIPTRRLLERTGHASTCHERRRRAPAECVDTPDVRATDADADAAVTPAARAACVVCWDAQPTVVFLNCRHMCCCAACARLLGDNRCPCCRRDILVAMPVYV